MVLTEELRQKMQEHPDLYDETGFPVRGTVRLRFRECDLVQLARETYPEFDFDQVLELEFPREDIIHYEYMFVNVQKYLRERFPVAIKTQDYFWSIESHFDVLNLDELESTFAYYYEDEGWY